MSIAPLASVPTNQLHPAPSAGAPSFSLAGDPLPLTRLSGFLEWSLHGGPALQSGLGSVSVALQAAAELSAGGAPTVAVVNDGATFAVHAVKLGFTQLKPLPWARPTSSADEFQLADAMKKASYSPTSGALHALLPTGGSGAAPSTPLVALVDGPETAHVAFDSSVNRWGFESGTPSIEQ